MAALPDEIRNHPMVLPLLERFENQGEQFPAAQAATDEHRQHRVVAHGAVELRLLMTADLACSRSGSARTRLGALLFFPGCGFGIDDGLQVRCRQLAKARLTGTHVAQAVARERTRADGNRVEPDAPATERGRRMKADLDMPTTLVNRIVSTTATRRLRSFKPRGKPS